MSSTKTTTDTYTLPLTGSITPPLTSTPSTAQMVEPLVASGNLTEELYPRIQLTPAVGVQFGKETQLKDVLELKDLAKRDEILRDLAIESK